MPLARCLGILDFKLSGLTIGQVKLLHKEILHILDGQPCRSHCYPNILRRNIRRLHFLQRLDICLDIPEFIIADTKLFVLAAADKVFHLFIIGRFIGWPCSNNLFSAGLFFLLVQVNIIRSR